MIKLLSIKRLQNTALNLWKDICFIRDGRQCQVQKYFPQLKIAHSEVLQVDHAFSRKDKNLFLEVSNGTVVCSSCNRLKHFQFKNIHRLIDQIVISREGQSKFNEMQRINESGQPNIGWSKRYWLEEKIRQLKNEELRQEEENKSPLEFTGFAQESVFAELRPCD